MTRLIYVVYLKNEHAPPTGLKAFKWEPQARDYAMMERHKYPNRVDIMLVMLED